MPENECEAVAEFIRTKGITRCPTACVLRTQGLVAAADRIALEEHAIARDHCAEHKPLLAGDHFKLDGPIVASLV